MPNHEHNSSYIYKEFTLAVLFSIPKLVHEHLDNTKKDKHK